MKKNDMQQAGKFIIDGLNNIKDSACIAHVCGQVEEFARSIPSFI